MSDDDVPRHDNLDGLAGYERAWIAVKNRFRNPYPSKETRMIPNNLPEHSLVTFGDELQARDYQLERARALAEQSCKFAVAPRATVIGRTAGAEVLVGDVGGLTNMRALIARGAVLELPDEVLRRRRLAAEASHIVVGKRIGETGRFGGLLAGGRMLSPGDPIMASDLATPGLAERVDQSSGRILPAVPATDGVAALQRLVDAGLVLAREPAQNGKRGKS